MQGDNHLPLEKLVSEVVTQGDIRFEWSEKDATKVAVLPQQEGFIFRFRVINCCYNPVLRPLSS